MPGSHQSKGDAEMKTDLDLPLACRTQANLWKAKYYEMRQEVVNCNKGLRRLRKRLEMRDQQKHIEPHTGFCMGEYDDEKCHDCPTLKECLELRDKDRKEAS